MKKRLRNFIARDLFSAKYKKRIVRPKKGKGSYKRKKKVSLV
ncbi:MAG TPA: ribosome alternative rescue factor ArfA [Pelagibacteraceae bacterium]|nr:ribosome alternative rescue factor ArfA [Pelagibacteraceae bacterium]